MAAWMQAQDWFAAYGRYVLAVLGVLVLLVGGWFLWQRQAKQKEAQAGVQLAETRGLYWRGDYPTVIQRTDEIRQNFGGTVAALEALRIKGDALYWQGDFKAAAEAYEAYLAKAKKDAGIVSGVQENLAQAYESDQQFQKAAESYEAAAAVEAPRDIVAQRLLSAGYAWRAAGNNERATELFQRVRKDYPDTPSSFEAERVLGEMRIAGDS